VLFLVICQISLAKKDSSSIILAPQGENNCQTLGLQCRDCETIQYCSNNREPIFQIKCADQSKGRPHCDSTTNTCVKAHPAVCNIDASPFICPGEGTYPDLENCKNYYVCDENKVPTTNACLLGQIYDHTSQGCVRGFACKSYSSKTGQCKARINQLVTYAPSRDLYILCLSGRPSLLFQCPIKGDVFNEEEAQCRFECTQRGYFQNHANPSEFYYCTLVGKKLVASVLTCPLGTEFVQLGVGQGICTTTTTTSTTTEAVMTIEPEVEGSGESPEEDQNEAIVAVADILNDESGASIEDSVETVEDEDADASIENE